MSSNREIKIKMPTGGFLVLDRSGKHWEPRGRVRFSDIDKAERITEGYTYSVAHGYPGYLLAGMVADAVGGEAILPELPPNPPGTVY